MKKQDVEIINIEVQNLKDSITWWQNRFNAVERNNRDLKVEVDRLNNIINELEKYIKTNAPREIRGNITGDYEVYIDGQFLFNKLQELKGEDKE